MNTYTRPHSGPSRAGAFAPRRTFSKFGPKKAGPRFTSNRNSGGRKGRGGGYKKDFIDEKLFIRKASRQNREVYVAKHTFRDFGLDVILLSNIESKGYTTPSPIQDQTIPLGMSGRDVIGIANTGTGKTAAFLLPLIQKILKNRKEKVLILAPTRELAQQIEAEFKAFTVGMKLFSVACVGGAPIGKQIRELDMGVHVVIGTPGRVKDLITRGKFKPALFANAVLDEADRMLDMGFIEDIRGILAKMPKERQSFFFSATFSPVIQKLCGEFLNDPITVSVRTGDTAENVQQDVVRYGDRSQKIEVLHSLLKRPECAKVLIFRETKRSVDELSIELTKRGLKALGLHGDMRNRERERAVKALATGNVQVVIATDVAARGIDIPDISHVINYDIPGTYDTYIHRIGRTGRGDRMGNALTFI